jgi:hypothetical protein
MRYRQPLTSKGLGEQVHWLQQQVKETYDGVSHIFETDDHREVYYL